MISEPNIITTEPEEQSLHTWDTEDWNKIIYNKLLLYSVPSLKSGKEMFSRESNNRKVSAVANAVGIRGDIYGG